MSNVELHVMSEDIGPNINEIYNKLIIKTVIEDDILRITLDDGQIIKILDNGQQCCERRYMTCDDDLSKLIGGHLTRIETRVGPNYIAEDGGDHDGGEQAFIEVGTDQCFITLCTHNEHNGYYGGFHLCIDIEFDPEILSKNFGPACI